MAHNFLHKAMNKLDSIKQGYQAQAFAKEHEGYRDYWGDISEWGDPSGKIIGHSDSAEYHPGRPIYEGGYTDMSHVQSEINVNKKEARNEEGPVNIPWDRSMALEGAGSSPYRLGGLDDPYEGWGTDEQGMPSIGNVGVTGVRGGSIGDEYDDYFTDRINVNNTRGDYITSTDSQRGRGPGSDYQSYLESVYQTPEGPTKYSQLGKGRGSTQYFEHPTKGSGSWSKKGLLGWLGIPTGTYSPKGG